MEKKQRKKAVDSKVFVKAWQSSKNIDEVLKATGMNLQSAQFRARMYRKRGVKLQTFVRRNNIPRLDVEGLNKLIGATSAPAAPKSIAAKKAVKKPAKKSAKKRAK